MKTGKVGDTGRERRRHPRHAIVKKVRTRHNSKEHKGRTKDISAGGIAVEPNVNMGPGDAVEVAIDDLGVFHGMVARAAEDSDFFAITFNADGYDKDDLISELTRIHDNIATEES
ncbi:MAG TPA: PilZ domain-containing protein [Rhodospirillales bacterium]|nr:PilZ domain-containing protein [Rhodospirillales bacterium]